MYQKLWKVTLVFLLGFGIGLIFTVLAALVQHNLSEPSKKEELCDTKNHENTNILLQSMFFHETSNLKDNFTFRVWIKEDQKENRLTYESWLQKQHVKLNKNIDMDQYVYSTLHGGILLESNWLKFKVHITCIVFVEKLKLAQSIKATWAKRCNKLHFFSRNLMDLEIPIINFEIKLTSSWQLLCESMNYVWRTTLKNNGFLQWVIFVNDDTMVVPENLRYLVAPLNHDEPYYLGHAVTLWGRTYNVAQSGYVLSKAAFQKIVEASNNSQSCALGGKYWKKEDYYLGKHLASMDIHPSDTRDEYLRASFHAYSFQNLLLGVPNTGSYWTRAVYPAGPDCCSTRSVTFNVGDSERMHTLYYMLYHLYVYKNGGIYGNRPAPTSAVSDTDVWKNALKEEFNITVLGDISSERYYEIWHSKYKEPGEFIKKDPRSLPGIPPSL